jgi:Family of unknown function (DUF6134)
MVRIIPIANAALIAAALSFSAPCFAIADGRTLAFDIYRSGSKIGTHTIRFKQVGDKLTADIDISLKGKVFFISFSYLHRNQEIWQGDTLISLNSRTVQNGKTSILSATRRDDGMMALKIDGIDSIGPAMMSTSYWNPQTPKQAALLNSQKGEAIPLTIESRKSDLAPLSQGGGIPATAYAMTGPKKFNATALYDVKGCFVGLNFKAPKDITRISYKLTQRLDGKLAPDLRENPQLAACLIDAPKGT